MGQVPSDLTDYFDSQAVTNQFEMCHFSQHYYFSKTSIAIP